jgi:SPP1 family predicted phage head-tail adaptor
MKLAVGELDRRIQVQLATPVKDSAGDPVDTWADAFKLWAKKVDGRPTEDPAVATAQQVLRAVDTVFTVRFNEKSSGIGPESHRVVYRNRIYEIVGLGEGDREDAIRLLCSSRPDQRGARGVEAVSGQP